MKPSGAKRKSARNNNPARNTNRECGKEGAPPVRPEPGRREIMRKEFLPFTKPAINEDDIQAVTAVLRSGWITNGPKNQELEAGVCAFTGNRYGVALSSARW